MKRQQLGLCVVACAALMSAACGTQSVQTHSTSYPSGAAKWRAQLVAGVPDGPSTTWHENGQVASQGNYRLGLREGEFTYWDEYGEVIRRDRYAEGRLIATWVSGTAVAVRTPSMVAPIRTEAPAPADHYSELRVGMGFGGNWSARRMDEGRDTGDGTVSLVGSLLVRRGHGVYGASLGTGAALFGPSHTYGGLVAGLASKGDGAHLELLGEVGLHGVSAIGTDLFTDTAGDTSSTLPYVGAMARLVMDPGEAKHFVLALTASGRMDLGHDRRDVVTTTCFFGCSSETEQWAIGGRAYELTLGIGYQFD